MGGARAICHRAIARAVVGGGGAGWFGVVGVVEPGVGTQLQHHRAWSRAASAGAIGVTRWCGALSRMSPPAATSGDGGRGWGCFAADGSRTAHSAAGDGAKGGGSNHGFATVAKVSGVCVRCRPPFTHRTLSHPRMPPSLHLLFVVGNQENKTPPGAQRMTITKSSSTSPSISRRTPHSQFADEILLSFSFSFLLLLLLLLLLPDAIGRL